MLLFLVGLKLDVRVIRDTGRVSCLSPTGAVGIGLTAALGFGLALLLWLGGRDRRLRRDGADVLEHDHRRQAPVRSPRGSA